MTAEEKTINKIFYLHSVLALESNKHNREVITSRINKCLKDYHKESSKELVEALEDQKETLIEYQKFLINNDLIGSNASYNAELFLKSKIK